MRIRNSRSRWGLAAQILHWTTALLILVTMPIGWWANSLQRGPTERALFDIHFQLGFVIFLLFVARVLWRLMDPAPQAPGGVGRQTARAAAVAHALLYLTILTMLVSGYIIQVHMQPALKLAGGLAIPRPFEPGEDETLRAFAWYVHTYGFWAIGALIVLHVAAALWRHFVRRDDVLVRMLPFGSRGDEAGSDGRESSHVVA